MTEHHNTPNTPADLPEPAHLLEGVYVVLVAHHTAGELRTRRRVFFNLPAAQRAVDRATMRGQHAAVIMCRLNPVRTFAGGWSA